MIGAILLNITVSYKCKPFLSLSPHKTGAVATRGSEFGLLDQTPILQNPMCHGNESDLSECPGYHLNNVVGGNCLNNQAGFRCIESKNLV